MVKSKPYLQPLLEENQNHLTKKKHTFLDGDRTRYRHSEETPEEVECVSRDLERARQRDL